MRPMIISFFAREHIKKLAKIALITVFISGCGTYVPSLRPFPNDNPLGEGEMITAIIRSINCELASTVTDIIRREEIDARKRPSGRNYATFLNDWGVEVAINLTAIERSAVNPTAIFTPAATPLYAFTAATGFSSSTDATREQRTNLFFTVKDLYNPTFFANGASREKCLTATGDRKGSPLVDSDLRLTTLLDSRINSTSLGYANSPAVGALVTGEKNVLSQTVSFKIMVSGGVNPAFKLVPVAFNQTGNFLSGGRDDTQELVFTFGPLAPGAGNRRSLTALAETTHINAQLLSGLRNVQLFR